MSNLQNVIRALPEKLNPMNYGGVVAGQFRSTDPEAVGTGDLASEDEPCFLSRYSLPDVEENAKIVAVCGINDWNAKNDKKLRGQAAPDEDGWFFSDFLFLHHLLKPAARDQQWLMCVDPEDLVKKYGPYIHGSPPSVDPDTGAVLQDTRRVVLDQSMLDNGDLRDIQVIEADSLKLQCSQAIKRAVRVGEEQDRPVLIMIFSHGREKDFKMQMGGSKEGMENPLFGPEDLKNAIGSSKCRICFLTPACYSGGWAINPNLNISSVTAASAGNPSDAWPPSRTINNRTTGSPFVSCIAELFANISVPGFESELEKDEVRHGLSFAGFTKVMTDTIREIDTRAMSDRRGGHISIHHPMFSAQDDEWERNVSDRIGIPLHIFQERWLQLKAAAGYQKPPSDRDEDMCRLHPRDLRCFSYDQMVRLVSEEAKEYMASSPGRGTAGFNVILHNKISILLRGNRVKRNGEIVQLSMSELESMHHTIDYRMNQIMRAATTYKDTLGIVTMLDCQDTDLGQWYLHQNWRKAKSLVDTYSLFDEPGELSGHPYYKGTEYIAACIVEARWNRDTAEMKLNSLVKHRSEIYKGVSKISNTGRYPFTMDYWRLQSHRALSKAAETLGNSFGKSSRSISPIRKRGRIPGWMKRDSEAQWALAPLLGELILSPDRPRIPSVPGAWIEENLD